MLNVFSKVNVPGRVFGNYKKSARRQFLYNKNRITDKSNFVWFDWGVIN
jgi:hypothetical protein